MEQSPSWEANSSVASQEIFRITEGLLPHSQRSQLVPFMGQISAFPSLFWRFILILSSHLRLGL